MMSFRDFKEEISLVLQVKEGYGFGFALNPIIITANFVGNVHESFVTEPCPQPKFEHEFVWVMEKTRMKGIWADKAPVRVECFTVDHSHRSKIGYVFLNVKDAQIIHEESKITEKQIRLLGLSKEASLYKPEIIISFYITDVPLKIPQLIPQYSPRLGNGKMQMSDGTPRASLGTGNEHFNISIEVDSVSNLNELLPTGSDIDESQITYSYHLLGADIVSDSTTSHSVRVDVISSLATLKTYFLRESAVPIKLFVDTLLIGETTIVMENLILSDKFLFKKSKHQLRSFSCRCEVIPTHKVIESPSKVFVYFVVTFSYEAQVIKDKLEPLTVLPVVGAGGDADRGQIMIPLERPVTQPLERPVTQPLTSRVSGSETYRTQPTVANYTLNITVTNFDLDEEVPPQPWLRIVHPSLPVSPQKLPFPTTWTQQRWQLSMTCQQLESCKLFLMSGLQVYAEATLIPPSNLFSVPPVVNEQIAVLEGNGDRLGQVRVMWETVPTINSTQSVLTQTVSTLTDPSISLPTRENGVTCTQSAEVLSPRTRELKIRSFVEELEDWAEKQRTLVMGELKEEEAARLSRLETEVGNQVTEGLRLIEALRTKKDQLQSQERTMLDSHQKLKVYKEELDRDYQSKLQEFKDLSRRMQDEFNHKLALIASDKAALEKELGTLREENVEIKRRLREVEARADKDKGLADSLTRDMKQLTKKLSEELESKQFFKDHCRKAEQEIHRLNCLRQQDMESFIFKEKKTLEQLAFQHIIVEKQDLRQDQKVLDEIRYQLLHGSGNADTISNSNMESLFPDERHIHRTA